MSSFFKRTLSGIVFIILVIGSILWNPMVFIAVFQLFILLGLWEFYNMVKTENTKPLIFWGLVLGSFNFLVISLSGLEVLNSKTLLLNLPLFFITFLIPMFRNKKNNILGIALTWAGITYVALPFGLLSSFFLNNLNPIENGNALLLGFLFLIWVNDTFAYLFGSMLGRHKLFERISPKKTWEGFIWGGIFAFIMAYVNSLIFSISLNHWLIISSIVIVFGTLGDLAESWIKRIYGQKDSGSIMPGHGGILDRFDGILFSAPLVFLYICFFV